MSGGVDKAPLVVFPPSDTVPRLRFAPAVVGVGVAVAARRLLAVGCGFNFLPEAESPLETLLMALIPDAPPDFLGGFRTVEMGGRGLGASAGCAPGAGASAGDVIDGVCGAETEVVGTGAGAGISIVIEAEVVIPITSRRFTSS